MTTPYGLPEALVREVEREWPCKWAHVRADHARCRLDHYESLSDPCWNCLTLPRVLALLARQQAKAVELLQHMKHCQVCGDGPWSDCEVGREATAWLAARAACGLEEP